MHSSRSEGPYKLSDQLVFSTRSSQERRAQYQNFLNNAYLRSSIQNSSPDWNPTGADRYLAGQIRDIAARLHPESLAAHPESEATQLVLATRAITIFTRSLHNLARSCTGKPLERTCTESLESTPCPVNDPLYRSTYLSSLWAVQCSLAAFSDNQPLLREFFAVMRCNLPKMLVIFKDDDLWQGVATFMYNLAAGSPSFRAVLLEQEKWLSWTEADLPPLRPAETPPS